MHSRFLTHLGKTAVGKDEGRLRDEIKRLKLLDLEFANEALTGAGQEVDRAAPKGWRAEAKAEKAGVQEGAVVSWSDAQRA